MSESKTKTVTLDEREHRRLRVQAALESRTLGDLLAEIVREALDAKGTPYAA